MECRVSLFQQRGAPLSSVSSEDDSNKKENLAVPKGMTAAQAAELRLPIPKNVVLMAMLDNFPKPDNSSMSRQDVDGDDEVREGVHRILQSNYGTFAVCAPSGLEIHRHAPPSQDDATVATTIINDGDDDETNNMRYQVTVVSCESIDSSMEPTEVRLQQHRRRSQNDEGKEVLLYGQTVQVVSYDGETAVLARNRGYLRATPNQLVKVGDARDEACRIEGMLTSLEQEEDQLRRELESMDQKIAILDKELEHAISVPYEETIMVPSNDSDLLPETTTTTAPTTPCRKPASAPVSPSSASGVGPTTRPPPQQSAFFSLPPNMSAWLAGEDQVLRTVPSTVMTSPSRSSVNFRTGMSGHSGLTRMGKQSRGGEEERHVRTMGDHRGVGRIGHMRR